MWKTLHQLAIPPRLYQICGWFIPWLAIASVVVLTVGWIWGFGFAPADYQQGNSYRIIYLHVPAAIWSMGIYASMAAGSQHRKGGSHPVSEEAADDVRVHDHREKTLCSI